MTFKQILRMMLITAGTALLIACNSDKETTESIITEPEVTEPVVTEPVVPITSIAEIQGDGHISPHVGAVVTTQGIVTALAFRSYYIQDAVGDGNEETSEGLFISHKDHGLNIGDKVQLTAYIIEKIPGGKRTGNLSITQMDTPSTVVISTANSLPAATVIGLNGRIAPSTVVISDIEIVPPVNLQNAVDDAANIFNPAIDGIDFYESLEAMLGACPRTDNLLQIP